MKHYGYFVRIGTWCIFKKNAKKLNSHNFFVMTLIKKLKLLYFKKLQKFKKQSAIIFQFRGHMKVLVILSFSPSQSIMVNLQGLDAWLNSFPIDLEVYIQLTCTYTIEIYMVCYVSVIYPTYIQNTLMAHYGPNTALT